jgi:uncharacterized protein (DUF983 family)
MPNKAQSISSFIACRCPRCQTGKVFTHSTLHPKFIDVNENCPACGIKFQTEPGFFWGAMYFSYALIVGISIIAGIVLYSIYETPPLVMSSLIIIGIILASLPFILRYSRMLLISVIAPYRKYDPKAIDLFKKKNQS